MWGARERSHAEKTQGGEDPVGPRGILAGTSVLQLDMRFFRAGACGLAHMTRATRRPAALRRECRESAAAPSHSNSMSVPAVPPKPAHGHAQLSAVGSSVPRTACPFVPILL